MKKYFIIFILITCINSSAYAANFRHTIDCGSIYTWLTGLRELRELLGNPLPQYTEAGLRVYEMRLQNTDELIEGGILTLTNYGSPGTTLRLVLDPRNLYITGFISQSDNIFYRFSDQTHRIQLSSDISDTRDFPLLASDYGSLMTQSQIWNEDNFRLDTNILRIGVADLNRNVGLTPTREAISSLMQTAILISESTRFPRLAEDISQFFEPGIIANLMLSRHHWNIIHNWRNLSELARDATNQSVIRVRSVEATGLYEISSIVGLILYCMSSSNGHISNYIVQYKDIYPMCNRNNYVKIKNTYWSRSNLIAPFLGQ